MRGAATPRRSSSTTRLGACTCTCRTRGAQALRCYEPPHGGKTARGRAFVVGIGHPRRELSPGRWSRARRGAIYEVVTRSRASTSEVVLPLREHTRAKTTRDATGERLNRCARSEVNKSLKRRIRSRLDGNRAVRSRIWDLTRAEEKRRLFAEDKLGARSDAVFPSRTVPREPIKITLRGVAGLISSTRDRAHG